MFGQKTFAVYGKPGEGDVLGNAMFVREGFSIMAYIFSFFWALYHRIWWLAGVCFVIIVGKHVMLEYGVISERAELVFTVAFLAFLAFQAQDWYGESLQREGYALIGIVIADNLEDAQQRFFDKYIAHAQSEPKRKTKTRSSRSRKK